MDISIIGAGGTIGRQIAIALIQERVIPPSARLQLIGRRGGPSKRALPGLADERAIWQFLDPPPTNVPDPASP